MTPKLIYIAEDEKNIRNLIVSFLKKENYDVVAFENGDALYEQFTTTPADLVILDVMMPGSSGFIICTKLREVSTVPIIMLTARDSDEDHISGISLGSDAYFTKPFSPIKLLMQVKAMLRRAEMAPAAFVSTEVDANISTFADIKVVHDKMAVFCHDVALKLTKTEFSLLAYLVDSNGRAVSREELLTKVWGYHAMIETRATDDTVSRLRKKLTDANSQVMLETVRGYGFKLNARTE